MNPFRVLVPVVGISVVSCDPTVARAADAPRGNVGVGVGSPLTTPLAGVGLGGLGLGYGAVWIEPRLTPHVALVAALAGDYQRASVPGESVSTLWCAPGVGLRWYFGGERVRPSGYVLVNGSYARQRSSSSGVDRWGTGAEAGLSLDGALSEVVWLRLSAALASVSHTDDTSGGAAVTGARVGIAPFVGTAISF
jgi:hypothetical protein